MADFFLLDDFIDFQLIGINSTFENVFQFIFYLNTNFGSGFQRINDLDILINQQEFFFPTFHWFDTSNKLDYHIIKNRPAEPNIQNNGVDLYQLFPADFPLVTKYKSCNYILKITGWEDEIHQLDIPFKTNEYINKLEVYDIDDISDAERLIF